SLPAALVLADINELLGLVLGPCPTWRSREYAACRRGSEQHVASVDSGHCRSSLLLGLPQPLTAPEESPATRCFWAMKEKMITGRMTSIPDAVSPPQSMPESPALNAAIITGNVCVALLVSTAANRKSFHASCRHRMLAATSPGRAIGSMIWIKVPKRLAPSTHALSSSSIGRSSK